MMLRVYSGNQKGATAFFRNRVLLNTLGELLKGQSPKVLFHSVSIGAEAFSFAVYCKMHDIRCECIHATDVNQEFLEVAKQAKYPATIEGSMSDREKEFFEPCGDGLAPICEIRNAVSWLPPCSFVDAAVGVEYDVVFVMNALTYVTPAEQAATIASITKSLSG